MPREVDADLVHHLYDEGVELATAHADGIHIDAVAEQVLQHGFGHRRSPGILRAGEQHRFAELAHGCARMWRTQISGNIRRPGAKSISILPSGRARSREVQSFCRLTRSRALATTRAGLRPE